MKIYSELIMIEVMRITNPSPADLKRIRVYAQANGYGVSLRKDTVTVYAPEDGDPPFPGSLPVEVMTDSLKDCGDSATTCQD